MHSKLIGQDSSVLQELCKLKNKFGMYISLGALSEEIVIPYRDWRKAALYLNDWSDNDLLDLSMYGCAYLFFDTAEEMTNHYNQTVGDDGPTELNPYNGAARIYALTCSNEGELQGENT